MKKKETPRPFQKVGEKLKELRGPKSQGQFAGEINISLQSYHRYESGLRMPPLKVLTRIASLYGITIDWITRAHVLEEIKKVHEHPTPVRPMPVPGREDPAFILSVIDWISRFWISASGEEKTWFKVQFSKCFPHYVEWSQNQRDSVE